jgi:hypothetical protein
MSENGLFTVAEAVKETGYSSESSLYRMAKQGTFAFEVIDGRNFITAEDVERMKANRKPYRRQEPVVTEEREQDADPLLLAIAAIESGLRHLKKTIKEHDSQVRREAVRSIAESLREAAK